VVGGATVTGRHSRQPTVRSTWLSLPLRRLRTQTDDGAFGCSWIWLFWGFDRVVSLDARWVWLLGLIRSLAYWFMQKDGQIIKSWKYTQLLDHAARARTSLSDRYNSTKKPTKPSKIDYITQLNQQKEHQHKFECKNRADVQNSAKRCKKEFSWGICECRRMLMRTGLEPAPLS
jgi:hypothetical protein